MKKPYRLLTPTEKSKHRAETSLKWRKKNYKLYLKRNKLYTKRWREKNKDYYIDYYKNKERLKEKHCRLIANNYIRAGKIFREKCVICNNINTEAHHNNYDFPLEITWLCKLHHEKLHKIKNKN